MADHYEIGGQEVKAGTKQIVQLPVTRDLNGAEVAISVHVVNGARSGPTLGLFSIQHGDEWVTLSTMRALIDQFNPQELAGTILVVPVCNPVALGSRERNTQPESDGPDQNRVWPGTHTWLAESMTKVIDEEAVRLCDALMDFHLGPWGSAFAEVFYGADFADPQLVQRCHEMAMAFGFPSLGKGRVVEVFPGPRSLMGYAGVELGIPGIAVEIGGAGFSTEMENNWIQETIRGVNNVLKHMEMMDGNLDRPEQILTYTRTVRVNPRVGGLLVPENRTETLLREVKKDEVLGRVLSPYTFEELEILRSPCYGWLVYMARTYAVRPGNWGFGIADAEGSEWVNV